MGSRVRIRLFHILHFVTDPLFPFLKNSILKNSKSGVDDRGHRLRITHTRRQSAHVFGDFNSKTRCTSTYPYNFQNSNIYGEYMYNVRMNGNKQW